MLRKISRNFLKEASRNCRTIHIVLWQSFFVSWLKVTSNKEVYRILWNRVKKSSKTENTGKLWYLLLSNFFDTL